MEIVSEKLSIGQALRSARETKCLEIGRNIIGKTATIFKNHFGDRTAVIVSDPITFKMAGEAVLISFQKLQSKIREPFVYQSPDLYAEHTFVVELENALKKHDAIPIAVGSGTINDLVKLASHRVGRPYMCVATAASMDGYTAFGASITYKGSKQTFNCPAPTAVLADVDIIRAAPPEMNASGYADLLAKITAGADWLVADALGVEPIDQQAWIIVQGGLRETLRNPNGVRHGDPEAINELTEGLMMGGFAMQWAKSSRPASGAEHQFSHLWDMQHHTHNGKAPAHGFKVGVATLAVVNLYEYILKLPLEHLDVDASCAAWPEEAELVATIRSAFDSEEIAEKAIEETRAKYISREKLREQLVELRRVWPKLRMRLEKHLLSAKAIKQMLSDAGAPVEPEQIGISRERLQQSYQLAYYIRRRFTLLDLVVRANLFEKSMEDIFTPVRSAKALALTA